jgi:hypothetical protein
MKQRPSSTLIAGYAAAVWAAVFAVFHLMWAGGWYIGLNQEEARKALANPWFMAYDLVVAAMLIVAAGVALALIQPWGRRQPRRLLGFFAWAGTGLLVLRAGASVVQATYLLLVGRFEWHHVGIWDPWFCLGAVLFSLITWRFWRAASAAQARCA